MDLNNRRTGKHATKPRALGLLGHSEWGRKEKDPDQLTILSISMSRLMTIFIVDLPRFLIFLEGFRDLWIHVLFIYYSKKKKVTKAAINNKGDLCIYDIHLRGLFKKFYYDRLSTPKNKVCLSDFVHKYFSFYYTCTSEISKESSKYQYSYWHLK